MLDNVGSLYSTKFNSLSLFHPHTKKRTLEQQLHLTSNRHLTGSPKVYKDLRDLALKENCGQEVVKSTKDTSAAPQLSIRKSSPKTTRARRPQESQQDNQRPRLSACATNASKVLGEQFRAINACRFIGQHQYH